LQSFFGITRIEPCPLAYYFAEKTTFL